MKNFLSLLLLISISISGFTQSTKSNENNFQENDCDGRIFIKVQQPPMLKISAKDYADTIRAYLNFKKEIPKDSVISYSLIVTKKSEIFGLIKETSSKSKTIMLENAIKRFSEFWQPAIQNSFLVCARVRIKFYFLNNNIEVIVLPN